MRIRDCQKNKVITGGDTTKHGESSNSPHGMEVIYVMGSKSSRSTFTPFHSHEHPKTIIIGNTYFINTVFSNGHPETRTINCREISSENVKFHTITATSKPTADLMSPSI